MKILWLTSCGADMWNASGRELVDSFAATESDGDMLLALENVPNPGALPANVTTYPLEKDAFLEEWLLRQAQYIPVSLGGRLKEPLCKCPGGPFDPHHKGHRMPCPGHWFNKNHSRWFRKIASLAYTVRAYNLPAPTRKYDAVIWVDSDCRFKQRTQVKHVRGWFMHDRACFYLKSKRPVLEAGVVGYNYAKGAMTLMANYIDRFRSGRYREGKRWDDCYQLQLALAETKVRSADIAFGVGPHAAVVEHSSLSAFLTHDKGRHGRKLKLMT